MDKIQQRVQQAIQERVFPGCVIGALQNGQAHVMSFGSLAYDDRPVRHEKVYDLASITKSIPVASLASRFCEEGKFALMDSVKTYLPELQNDFGATIEDLLQYRVKGPRMAMLRFSTFEEVRTLALERGFDGPPGEREYANFPAFVLGIILERVGGAQLPTLAHRYFFEPLQMRETTFFPSASDCAPTEIVNGEEIRGMVHDESARIFARKRRAVGHAGLFSTAEDLLKFARYLLDNPASAIVRDAQDGLGWQINDPYLFGSSGMPSAFGKTGFTGTSIMIDPHGKRALVILSNRTYPQRPADGSAINAFRCDIVDIVFA
jgi:CubicO group peptidase (beta-lactamase class C family)